MTPKGKKELIKSLSIALEHWFNEYDPNSSEHTDVGYVGDKYLEQLVEIVITALQVNSDSQEFLKKDGFLK
jgi:hypothetical protein